MRGKLGLVIAATFCVAVSGSSAPASATTVDDKMKSNLRNLATMEETYLTDHLHYGSAKQLRADGYHLHLGTGQVIYIHLDATRQWSYCFAGQVATHRVWIYDSAQGGLQAHARRHDACDPVAYPHAAGQYPAR